MALTYAQPLKGDNSADDNDDDDDVPIQNHSPIQVSDAARIHTRVCVCI